MKKTLLQHCTVDQQGLMDISKEFNKVYCDRLGFQHVVSDMKPRLPHKSVYFEKIGYLNEMLPQLDNGSLVVWADADTICVKHEGFENALPFGGIMGMVRSLHGVGGLQPKMWWNIGVVVMINNELVRDFFKRVALRHEDNDEVAAMAELRQNGWLIGDGIPMSSIDYKWNCWKKNAHVCKDPNVVSWHGYKGVDSKLSAMKEFAVTLKKH